MTETYRLPPNQDKKETAMITPRLSVSEALAKLARKGHFSDRPDTFALAQLLAAGTLTIEQIEPLDIQ